MTLTFRSVVRQEFGRYAYDKRRLVNYTLASYVGDDGHEYRKGFSSYSTPIVPMKGTHAELNALKEQFDFAKPYAAGGVE